MTYAQHRKIIDADSHLLELDDFLTNAAREADLPLLQDMDKQGGLPVNMKMLEKGRQLFEQRKTETNLRAECVTLWESSDSESRLAALH